MNAPIDECIYKFVEIRNSNFYISDSEALLQNKLCVYNR